MPDVGTALLFVCLAVLLFAWMWLFFDVASRDDLTPSTKALWFVAALAVPPLALFAYLVAGSRRTPAATP